MSSQRSPVVIPLSGELDIGRRDEVRRAFALGSSSGAILLDFAEVSYADSTLITELIRFQTEARAAGRRLAILIGTAQLARLVEYAGLADALPIFEERSDALRYLAGAEDAR